MRKLTKKALSLLLCVMLIATAISCAFSITAETGYTTVNGNKVYDAPVGLELDGDLSTWVGNTAADGNPHFVAENGVLKASQFSIAESEVGPARFKIPGAKVGDIVNVKYNFRVNLDALADDTLKDRVTGGERVLTVIVRQYNSTGTKITDETVALTYGQQGTKVSKSFTLESSDDFFRIIITTPKSLRNAWEMSEITVNKTTPAVVIDTPYTTVNGNKVYDAPVGLDFSDNLTTWVNVGDASNPNVVVIEGKLRAGSGITAAWDPEVGPARFKVPDVKKGDKVQISFDLGVNLDGLTEEQIAKVEANDSIQWPYIVHYKADGTEKTRQDFGFLKPSHKGTITSKEFIIEDPDEFFRIVFRSAKSLKDAWEISNITVATTPFEKVVDTDFTFVGTKVVYAEPVGLDFSEDLKTWINNTTPKGNPMYVAENGVLRASGLYDYDTGWQPVSSAYFKISDAAEGMAVQLSFNLSTEREGLPSTQTGVDLDWDMLKVEFVQYKADGTQKATTGAVAYKPDDDGKKTSDLFTIEDPDEFFQIIFTSPRNPGLAWRVSEITINTTTPNANGAPLYYGNEENGFVSTGSSWPQKLKPSEEIGNLDFSDGFIYWSGRDAGADLRGTLASDSFKLASDGDNKYITLKDEGYVDSMRTVLFNASNYDVQIGDKLVLIYDAKGDDVQQLRVTLVQDHLREAEYNEQGLASSNVSPGTPDTLVDKNAKLSVLKTSDGWTTYVTGVSKLVNDPTTVKADCKENIYLQIVIEAASGVAAGAKLDAAIDNIKIAKIDNGAYYDITTGEKIADMTINAETLTSVTDVILRGPVDYAADFNDDKKVDILDLVYLKKKLAGKVEN